MNQVKALRLDSDEERVDARDVREAWHRLIGPELARGKLAARRQQLAIRGWTTCCTGSRCTTRGTARWPRRPWGPAAPTAPSSSCSRTGTAAGASGRPWRSSRPTATAARSAWPWRGSTDTDPASCTLTLDAKAALVLSDDGLRVRRIATFKWSRLNASAVFPIDRLDPETGGVTLVPTPNGAQGLEVGNWVELVDSAIASRPAAAALRSVTAIDTTAGRVSLAGAPFRGRSSASHRSSASGASRGRRWRRGAWCRPRPAPGWTSKPASRCG